MYRHAHLREEWNKDNGHKKITNNKEMINNSLQQDIHNRLFFIVFEHWYIVDTYITIFCGCPIVKPYPSVH